MTLSRAPLAALTLAALLSLALARSLPRHRPLALTLAALAALDAARLAHPPRWLDVALCAAWWPLLALAVTGALWRRWHALAALTLAAWTLATASLLAASPPLPPEAWRAIWAASAAVQCGAALAWFAAAIRAGRWPCPSEQVALLLAAGSVADGAGAWAWGPAGEGWEIARWQSVASWAIVAGWQGRALLRARRL